MSSPPSIQNSEHIVSFYGAYLQDPHICMCMECMDKGLVLFLLAHFALTELIWNVYYSSFDNIYKKVGPVPEDVLGKIAFAVVSGLTYLYDVHRIIHRGRHTLLKCLMCCLYTHFHRDMLTQSFLADVKPSNMLFNSQGQIKICDFGVSGELINSIADTFVGTSTYMSVSRVASQSKIATIPDILCPLCSARANSRCSLHRQIRRLVTWYFTH